MKFLDYKVYIFFSVYFFSCSNKSSKHMFNEHSLNEQMIGITEQMNADEDFILRNKKLIKANTKNLDKLNNDSLQLDKQLKEAEKALSELTKNKELENAKISELENKLKESASSKSHYENRLSSVDSENYYNLERSREEDRKYWDISSKINNKKSELQNKKNEISKLSNQVSQSSSSIRSDIESKKSSKKSYEGYISDYKSKVNIYRSTLDKYSISSYDISTFKNGSQYDYDINSYKNKKSQIQSQISSLESKISSLKNQKSNAESSAYNDKKREAEYYKGRCNSYIEGEKDNKKYFHTYERSYKENCHCELGTVAIHLGTFGLGTLFNAIKNKGDIVNCKHYRTHTHKDLIYTLATSCSSSYSNYSSRFNLSINWGPSKTKGTHSDYSSHLNSLISDSNRAQDRINDKIKDLESQITREQNELNKLKSELSKISVKVSAAENAKYYSSYINTYHGYVNDYNNQIAELEKKLSMAQKKESISNELSGIESAISSLENNWDYRFSDGDSYDHARRSCETSKSTYRSNISNLQNTISSLKSDLKNNQDKSQNYNSEIENQQNKLKEIKSNLADIAKAKAKIQQESKMTQEKIKMRKKQALDLIKKKQEIINKKNINKKLKNVDAVLNEEEKNESNIDIFELAFDEKSYIKRNEFEDIETDIEVVHDSSKRVRPEKIRESLYDKSKAKPINIFEEFNETKEDIDTENENNSTNYLKLDTPNNIQNVNTLHKNKIKHLDKYILKKIIFSSANGGQNILAENEDLYHSYFDTHD